MIKGYTGLAVSVIGYIVFSINLMLMYRGESESYIGKTNYIAGAVFWISILVIIYGQLAMIRAQKKWMKTNNIVRKNKKKKTALKFASNKVALVMDCMLVVSWFGVGWSILKRNGAGFITFFWISTFIFFIGMHFITNSEGYYVVVNHKKILHRLKKKKMKTKARKKNDR